MASLELTPVFNVNVSVSLPTGMGPGNEFSDLTVINGSLNPSSQPLLNASILIGL